MFLVYLQYKKILQSQIMNVFNVLTQILLLCKLSILKMKCIVLILKEVLNSIIFLRVIGKQHFNVKLLHQEGIMILLNRLMLIVNIIICFIMISMDVPDVKMDILEQLKIGTFHIV